MKTINKISDGTLDVQTNVGIGTPHKALLQEIKEKTPDLLIMGAKG